MEREFRVYLSVKWQTHLAYDPVYRGVNMSEVIADYVANGAMANVDEQLRKMDKTTGIIKVKIEDAVEIV